MTEPQQGNDVLEALKRVQQQLIYLEKKIDTLIQQRPAQESRPFQKDRPFQRPFRPYGRPHGEHGNRDHGPREHGNSSEGPRTYGPRREGGHGHGYVPKKKPFYPRRER